MSQAMAEPQTRIRRRSTTNGPLALLRDEVEGFASSLWSDIGEVLPMGRLAPPLDVSETDTSVDVRMDLPGYAFKDIEVQLTNNTLSVSGTRQEEKEDTGRTFHRVERRHGSFSRGVLLPCSVDETKIDAQYKDGILTIKMPKTEEAKARKIKVHG